MIKPECPYAVELIHGEVIARRTRPNPGPTAISTKLEINGRSGLGLGRILMIRHQLIGTRPAAVTEWLGVIAGKLCRVELLTGGVVVKLGNPPHADPPHGRALQA